ncbi:MAG: DUF2891 family protein [Crocinitomix sp.]|nr:DUF2891 family protein [Crocinitomix sp.]
MKFDLSLFTNRKYVRKILLSVLLIFAGFTFAQDQSSDSDDLKLDYQSMEKFAALPLHCIETEYPYKLGQVISSDEDLRSPSDLHPIFYGCFDWHSSVHGHWLLVKAISKFPNTALSAKAIALFDKQFTVKKVKKELAYFQPKLNKSFERTYGWAWILKLQAELTNLKEDSTHNWSANLKPLTDHIATSYMTFLPKLVYPIRVGEHTNTAFGLSLAIDYARSVKNVAFEELIVQRSKDFYLKDASCPLSWEPSGFDFISPCLQEAELMSKVLDKAEFEIWIKGFLPQLFEAGFSLKPGRVADRTDGKLVHLDGLNFSRAWCLYRLAAAVPEYKTSLANIGDIHMRASMNQVAESDYMGSHWLASFLVYALEAREGMGD